MPKQDDKISLDAIVVEALPNTMFKVQLPDENRTEILAYLSGKMRKFRIRTGVGDRVIVEMSPYDLARGRISFRHKGDRPSAAAAPRRQNFRRR